MRHASTGGDLVPPSIMEEMKQVFENAEIFVIYGCTEISCMGTTFPVPRDAKVTRSFVGKPFPDVTVRVLDPKRALVPFGVVGEICFAGKGIVREYLHQPELTAEKFVTLDGRRFYQTGDMGRLHADGNLEILGRRDFQVQLRGIRVELGGIENTARELGLAAQCAVVAKKLDDDDVRLVAFLVKPRDSSVSAFRRALSAHLPDYMLPQNVVVLDAMPLTANGKLDRNRLQEMPWEIARVTGPRAPAESDIERKIAAVFCNVLDLREVGVDESFFDLGGHSLLAVIAIHEIEAALGVTLSPYLIFECATVRGLAAQLGGPNAGESRPILLNEKVATPPLFLLSGIHIYRELAKRLEGLYPVYGVFADSELGAVEPGTATYTVQELARAYVALIRREQPAGPYRLLGYSFAGIVAYEVAHQLRDAGEEVRFLALVDAVLPEWLLGWRFRVSQLVRAFSVPPRDLFAYVSARLRWSVGAPSSEFVRYGNDARVGPLEQQRDQINCRAAAEYMAQMRPFKGNVTLIASGERLRMDPLKSPTGGWSPFIPSLDVETIDADHFRMLSDDPHVSRLADILVKRLRALA
jgi:thioesterase domain-containing protein/acyl carrier protein